MGILKVYGVGAYMRIQDRLLRALNEEREVNKILLDFGFRWFMFGVGCGIIIEWLLLKG